MYKVIKLFADLQDNNHEYRAGDEFPRTGLKVSKARITELSTTKNRRGTPLIELVDDDSQHEDTKPQKKSAKRKS